MAQVSVAALFWIFHPNHGLLLAAYQKASVMR